VARIFRHHINMIIILAIFISIFAHALNNVWPLLNSPVGGMTVIQFAAIFLWSAIGLSAIFGFLFLVHWWVKNGILFKPNKWSTTWLLFGIIRWTLISGLFYVFFLMPVDISTGKSITGDSPWLGSIAFLFFSLGVYNFLTILRAWWELRSLPPELLEQIESNFEKYEITFDPVAHKLALLRSEWYLK